MVEHKKTIYITDIILRDRIIKSFEDERKKDPSKFWDYNYKNAATVLSTVTLVCTTVTYLSIKFMIKISEKIPALSEAAEKTGNDFNLYFANLLRICFAPLLIAACILITCVAIIQLVCLVLNCSFLKQIERNLKRDLVIYKDVSPYNSEYAVPECVELYFTEDDTLFDFIKLDDYGTTNESSARTKRAMVERAIIEGKVTKKLLLNLNEPLSLSLNNCTVDIYKATTQQAGSKAVNEKNSSIDDIQFQSEERELNEKMINAAEEVIRVAPEYRITIPKGMFKFLGFSEAVRLSLKD